MSKEAAEYYFEKWEPEYLDGNLSLSRDDVFKFAEDFHKHQIKKVLNVKYVEINDERKT